MKKRFRARIFVGVFFVLWSAPTRCGDGSLDKGFSRKEMLEFIASPIPVQFYDIPFKEVAPSGIVPGFQKILKTAQLPLSPFSPDWMPLSGSSFNQLPFQSIASQMIPLGSNYTESPFLSGSIRNIIDNFLAGHVGDADSSLPFPVITKLAFLERIMKQKGKEFHFDQLVDPNVKFPNIGSIEERYYKAITDRDIFYFYDIGVPNWWGFCDRAAIANLNPQSSRIKEYFEGGFCGPMPISSFDLDDMLAFLQPMDNAAPRFGMNRGNITEEHSLSPEVVLFEEAFGKRPLSAEQLLTLLHKNVHPKGPGIIIDESSDPRDQQYNASGIWNRPVFAFSESETRGNILVSKVTSPLVLRYARFLSKITSADSHPLLCSIEDLEKSVGENESAYNAWLESEYAKRVVEKGFKRKEQVLSSSQPEEMEALYKQSRKKVTDTFEKALGLAEQFKKQLESSKQSVTIKETVVRVWFPRQRRDWTFGPAPLFSREYHMVGLENGKESTPQTWDVSKGDYPPDLAVIAGKHEPKNVSLLGEALSQCTSLHNISKVLIGLARLRKGEIKKAKQLLTTIDTECLNPYLNEETIEGRFRKLNLGFDKVRFLLRSGKCLAKWPIILQPVSPILTHSTGDNAR